VIVPPANVNPFSLSILIGELDSSRLWVMVGTIAACVHFSGEMASATACGRYAVSGNITHAPRSRDKTVQIYPKA